MPSVCLSGEVHYPCLPDNSIKTATRITTNRNVGNREKTNSLCVYEVRNKQEIATVHIGMRVGVSLTNRCTFICV